MQDCVRILATSCQGKYIKKGYNEQLIIIILAQANDYFSARSNSYLI